MVITAKQAERIIALHAQVKSLRATLAEIEACRPSSGEMILKTYLSGNWGSSEKTFSISGQDLATVVLGYVRRRHDLRLEACLRELRGMNAEIPS